MRVRRPRDEHSSSRDRLDCALPAAHQAAADELGVQPPAHRAYGDCLVAEADFFAALVAFLAADFFVDEPPAAFFADFLATFAAFLAFFAGFLALFFAFLAALAALTGPAGRRPGRRDATPKCYDLMFCRPGKRARGRSQNSHGRADVEGRASQEAHRNSGHRRKSAC